MSLNDPGPRGSEHHQRGWWAMVCFNGLSAEQQERVVTYGNLEFGYKPTGECPNPAEVEVTTVWDRYPGPRFYCAECAVKYLATFIQLEPEPQPVVPQQPTRASKP